MRNTLIGLVLVLVLGGWFARNITSPTDDRIHELEIGNRELKEKLDNIQEYVMQAKSDLDDVESAMDTDESCNETNAASDASDVEDKLNKIKEEADY